MPPVDDDIQRGLDSYESRQFPAAKAALEAVLARSPHQPKALYVLGLIARSEGRFTEAVSYFERVVLLDQGRGDLWCCLAEAYVAAGRVSDAEACFRRSCGLDPSLAIARYELAWLLRREGRMIDAIEQFQNAVRIEPRNTTAVNDLGTALEHVGRCAEAAECYRHAITLDPKSAPLYVNLSSALNQLGQPAEAAAAGHRAIELDANVPLAYNNLAAAYEAQGLTSLAADCYRRSLQQTANPVVHSNLLLVLNYSADPATTFAEHTRWGDLYGKPQTAQAVYRNHREPDRRLRIGYVSPDFREHSVAYFFEPILRFHDRSKIEPVCYSDTARVDAFTSHLRELCPAWRNSSPLSWEQLAEQIRADEIDILVDLSGHTAFNRMQTFATKPAPIQVTYLGYPNTTGLRTVDYRLTDSIADPPDDPVNDGNYVERLVRLPRCFLAYCPSAAAPMVSDPPCLAGHPFTFGSLNALQKVTPPTLDRWCAVLHRVPDSRIVLKAAGLADAGGRARVIADMGRRGIDESRLILVGKEPTTAAHLAWYGRIDLALDTLPYNGTTTTCEALWMGVPVVTLTGDRHAGRVGTSLLTAAGLSDLLVADTEDGFLERAVHLAADRDRLLNLRRGLREQLRTSELMDYAGLTRHLESAYQMMWRTWLRPTPDKSSEPRVSQTTLEEPG